MERLSTSSFARLDLVVFRDQLDVRGEVLARIAFEQARA